MTRIQPTSLFNLIFPDREDVERGRYKYLCRFCGQPAVPPKRYYCSDECYWNCQRSVAWWFARRGTFDRDGGRCVKCGTKLDYDKTWDCHHIVPVETLREIAWDAVYGNPQWNECDKKTKDRGWAIIYTLLIHDINNLITLCPECHKKEHAAKPPMVEKDITTLDEFMIVEREVS